MFQEVPDDFNVALIAKFLRTFLVTIMQFNFIDRSLISINYIR